MRRPKLRTLARAAAVSLRVAAWAVVLGAWAALLFAYLLPQDFRDISRPYVDFAWAALLVRVVQVHAALFLLLPIALVSGFVRGRRLFVAALLPALFVLVPVAAQFAPRHSPGASAPAAAPRLRVMTANVMIFNDWYTPLIEQARERRPDLLLLQEFSPDWADAINLGLWREFPHRALIPTLDGAGLGIYSRCPIVGAADGVAPGREGRPQQRVVLDLGGGRHVALYNVHLRSPRTIGAVMDGRLAFAQLADAIAAEQLPFVVAGDFNFPDTAPQHFALKRLGLREAHEQAGKGRGATWPCRGPLTNAPGIRIDHVYFSEHFDAVSCETGRLTSSDHLPVYAELVLVDGQ
jgi:endonuclease/exonuclease/phosphatase (EEP) superfamily protein YafD